MRPRHKAAENRDRKGLDPLPNEASMRPRHKAAENLAARRDGHYRIGSFNEAAA